MDDVAQGIGHEKAAGAPVNLAETLAGQAHGRRVDDGQHFGQIAPDQRIEQSLVGVLELTQINMAPEIRIFAADRLIRAFDLGLQIFDMRRQEAEQTELVSLFVGKGGAFVHKRAMQQGSTARGHLDLALGTRV